jgi:hypothetical protein
MRKLVALAFGGCLVGGAALFVPLGSPQAPPGTLPYERRPPVNDAVVPPESIAIIGSGLPAI